MTTLPNFVVYKINVCRTKSFKMVLETARATVDVTQKQIVLKLEDKKVMEFVCVVQEALKTCCVYWIVFIYSVTLVNNKYLLISSYY